MVVEPGGKIDRMRAALAQCTMLPGSSHKRFARNLAAMYLDKITEKQVRHLIRLAWRYRRQIPFDLVPSKDVIDALDSGWTEQTVAGVVVMTTGPRQMKAAKPKRLKSQAAPLPLFEGTPP